MAQRRGGATSRCAGGTQTHRRRTRATTAVWLLTYLILPSATEAGLYSATDQIISLNAESVETVLVNSTAAIVAEFYASWCGHCVAFSPVYKSLARDIKEWKPAVDLAAVDCAATETRQLCFDYGIKGYPTLKFFHAYSKEGSKGLSLKGFPRDVRGLRHRIIDQLEKHQEPWPPACPPLEPISQAEIDSFFETNNVQHLALIFEDDKSYIGREVTLDLLQFENIAVRRVLSTEEGLVTKLGVTDFPSCYLYYPSGNFTRLQPPSSPSLYRGEVFNFLHENNAIAFLASPAKQAPARHDDRWPPSSLNWSQVNAPLPPQANLFLPAMPDTSGDHWMNDSASTSVHSHQPCSNIQARTFYSYALQRLPGVVRSGKPPPPDTVESLTNRTDEPWRPFNRSRVYMADLESTLDYSLRVELAAHSVFSGHALVSLKKYISVLVKARLALCAVWQQMPPSWDPRHMEPVVSQYFPGRPMVMNLLKSLNSWLQDQPGDEISYEALEKIIDNRAQSPNTTLPQGARWVGCQGSQPHFRGYPCGVWTLFHVLSVQAKKAEGTDAKEVLSTMRGYVHHFFGCRQCAEHFEEMAQKGLSEVNTLSAAVLWLWKRHNLVNNRLAGALSEDPNFPKIQWPSPEMCPSCHSVMENGEHRWNQDQVLSFLLSYYSSQRILTDYLEDENQILAKQREKHASQAVEARNRAERKAREASDSLPLPSQPTVHSEEEEEEEVQDEAAAEEEAEGGEGATADEIASDPTTWANREMMGEARPQVRRRPSIVGMRMREQREDIVDLDSFVNQHYKAKAMQLAASSRVKQRTLQRKEEPEPGPVFGLGMELDAGFGMVGLQPLEAELDQDTQQQTKQRPKRELVGRYLTEEEWSHKRQWMSALSIGFSRVDISLCVILYFLSCVCLLVMYLFFKSRLRLRKAKIALS
ncbi:Sulfhydryl oxidase 1 [Takifugu flavidus]|uniref:Sulfhydryl oxidase n=1 Tax=Takifugu flavidus TaxID=433684 RepID=A0A5C6MT46_9TELE|nr:Sulfhydryl oxidase 1 [Takifugu flavidus]